MIGKFLLRFRWAVVVLLIIMTLPAGYLIYMEEQGNFHPITPGEAYRSAQLDRDELEYYLSEYKIRSVINLRGENDGERWYLQEKATCRDFNVKHYDLGLKATREPSRKQLETLLRLFQEAPRPVLIHCQAGADRSGIAAAIWKVVIDGIPKGVAKEQLSIIFGHFPVGPTGVLDAFFEQWSPTRPPVQERSALTAASSSRS